MLTILVNTMQSASTQPLKPLVDNAVVWHQMSEALHKSFYRVLMLLVAILPGILAFIVALIFFTLIGLLVSVLLKRVLAAAKFDSRIARSRVNANWTPLTAPTELAGRITFWIFVLLGLIIGVSAFDTSFQSATTLPISLLPYLTHGVGAVFLLIAGTVIARFLARSVLISAVNAQLQYARILSLGVKWLVLVLTGAMILDHLQIGGDIVELAFGILFGGIVLTLALAVGLGSRDLVSRSLESRVERSGDQSTEHTGPASGESIRHF